MATGRSTGKVSVFHILSRFCLSCTIADIQSKLNSNLQHNQINEVISVFYAWRLLFAFDMVSKARLVPVSLAPLLTQSWFLAKLVQWDNSCWGNWINGTFVRLRCLRQIWFSYFAENEKDLYSTRICAARHRLGKWSFRRCRSRKDSEIVGPIGWVGSKTREKGLGYGAELGKIFRRLIDLENIAISRSLRSGVNEIHWSADFRTSTVEYKI